MEIREGKKVFHGIAIGKVRVFAKTENQVSRRKIEDTQAEVARFEDAKQKAIDQLHALYEKALKEVGEVNAQIFDVHAMMLDDGDYIDSIHNLIEGQNVNAEYAVAQTGDNFAKMFADMDDEYFKARSVDVKDISERVITILNGNDTASFFYHNNLHVIMPVKRNLCEIQRNRAQISIIRELDTDVFLSFVQIFVGKCIHDILIHPFCGEIKVKITDHRFLNKSGSKGIVNR